MELNFDQPSDCTLESATIQVTLDEDDEGLDPYRVDSLPDSECPVLITDYFGPGQIVGTSKRVLVSQSRKLEPSINALGNGGSLGGITNNKTFQHESRWMFRSHRVPDDRARGQTWDHRILKWEMTENDIEKYPVHSNKVFTAFAYEHSGQPFLMKVEISGKLRSRSDRLKNLTKKFGPRARRQEDISSTLIGAYLGHRRPLDELAKGLDSAMEMENQRLVPLVVPDAQTASFQQVAIEARPPQNPALEQASSGAWDPLFIDDRNPQPGLSLNGQAVDMLEETQLPALQNRTEPTLENLARVGECFRKPVRQEANFRGNISEASVHSSATTLVANRSETTEPGPPLEPQSHSAPVPKSQSSMAPPPQKVDENAMARVMEIAFLRLLIQVLIGIMDYFAPRKIARGSAEDHLKQEGKAPSRLKNESE